MDVGNLIYGSSAFSKSSLNVWKLLDHISFYINILQEIYIYFHYIYTYILNSFTLQLKLYNTFCRVLKLFSTKLSCFHISYFLQIALEYWGISRKEKIDPAIIQSKKILLSLKGDYKEAIAKRYQEMEHWCLYHIIPALVTAFYVKNFGSIMLLWIWHPVVFRDQSHCLNMNLLFLNSHNHTEIYQEEQSFRRKVLG